MKYVTYDIAGVPTSIPRPESYADCARLILSDYYRHTGRKASLPAIWAGGLTRTSVGFSFWFRLAQHKGVLYPLAKVMLRGYKRRWGLFIPPRTVVGWGLYIQHCCGIIINPDAVIGNNVNLGQLTTIGSNLPGRAARIGSGVYIGPGVNVVDDAEIGEGACVGAGAVVTRRIEPGTTVAGVPARPINAKSHPEYIRNPWPI